MGALRSEQMEDPRGCQMQSVDPSQGLNVAAAQNL